jgi:hypothetical protein
MQLLVVALGRQVLSCNLSPCQLLGWMGTEAMCPASVSLLPNKEIGSPFYQILILTAEEETSECESPCSNPSTEKKRIMRGLER